MDDRPSHHGVGLLLLGLLVGIVSIYYFLAGALGIVATFGADVEFSKTWILYTWTTLGAAGIGLAIALIAGRAKSELRTALPAGLRATAALCLVVAGSAIVVSGGAKTIFTSRLSEMAILFGFSIVCLVVAAWQSASRPTE